MANRSSPALSVERFPLVSPGEGWAPALGAILRRLALARSVPEIMDVVVGPVRTLLGADGVCFVLRDGDMCHYADEDAIAPLWKGRRFAAEDCISGWCMEHSTPASVPDITVDARIPQEAYRPTFVKSLAMVPAPQDRPIAAIGAYWSRKGAPSEEAVGLLQTLANAAAMAIAKVDERPRRERAEAQKRELFHQLKNQFILIDVLARHSEGDTVESYREAFLARLTALREVREEIAGSGMEGACLKTILRRILEPLAKREERLVLDGPSVWMDARAATDLAFVIGELGTNAAKHGALSAEAGQLRISWHWVDDALEFSWTERGGPEARSPERIGFGTRFLEMSVRDSLGGTLERHFEPEGLSCVVRFPVG